jgi:prepilin-type N-terminal cleavage/methylation domain-containing protein
MMRFFQNKAFTLVELLVVIAIVGLLSTIVLAVTSGVSEQGRIAKSLQFSQHLENSLGAYLIGRWTFDEGASALCGSSMVCDSSGWGNHGVMNYFVSPYGFASDTPFSGGYSMSFGGTDDYVRVIGGILEDESELSFSVWFKAVSQAEEWARFFDYGWTNDAFMFVYKANNELGFWTSDTDNVHRSAIVMLTPDNQWHHAVGVWKSGEVHELYLDGRIVYVQTSPSSFSPKSANLDIGGKGIDNSYNGLLDEAAVYNAVLTASQIKNEYYAGLDRLLARGLISEIEYQQRLILE